MILYFSATGNSKYCAEQIATRVGSELYSLNADKQSPASKAWRRRRGYRGMLMSEGV